MKKIYIAGGFIGVLIILAIIFQDTLRGILPLLSSPEAPITDLIPETRYSASLAPLPSGAPQTAGDSVLTLPQGFEISIFAKNLPGARDIIKDSRGNLWVSQTNQGKIALLEINEEQGALRSQDTIFSRLRNPHGLAFHPDDLELLYIAEENKVSRVKIYTGRGMQKLFDLPAGGNHITRSLLFEPKNKKLLISIGSTCNVCREHDARRGSVLESSYDGTNIKEYARGLRNAVFMILHPETGAVWATEMGRDHLEDNTPPDEINIIEQGKNYGWPICYGQNIHDTAFDKNTYIRNPCTEPFETQSLIDIPAHSAPLGLAFIPKNNSWPEEFQGDLLVAYHGSWNRSAPTGYKVVRLDFDQNGKLLGNHDFITGWFRNSEVLGRPVDLLVEPGGGLYITDDRAGVVYKVQYHK